MVAQPHGPAAPAPGAAMGESGHQPTSTGPSSRMGPRRTRSAMLHAPVAADSIPCFGGAERLLVILTVATRLDTHPREGCGSLIAYVRQTMGIDLSPSQMRTIQSLARRDRPRRRRPVAKKIYKRLRPILVIAPRAS